MADITCLDIGIEGEETTQGYEGLISINSFNMGGGRAVDKAALQGDSAASDVSVSINLSKTTDKSSAPLWKHFLEGKRIDEATIYVLRNTPNGMEKSLELKLKNAMLDSFSYSTMQGSPGRGDESFSIVCAELEGVADKQVFAWNFLTNTAP